MISKKKEINDLEYLAQIGSQGSLNIEADVNELLSEIRSRTVGKNKGLNLMFVSFVTGLFLGVTAFFAWYYHQNSTENPRLEPQKKIADMPTKVRQIELDTLVLSEKFISETKKLVVRNNSDTEIEEDLNVGFAKPEIMVLKSMSLNEDSTNERSLKYSYNASVKFINDLKICNYYTLYFKGGKLWPISGEGTAAEKANNLVGEIKTNLKEKPEVYVHELLADGLFQYKNGKYLESVVTLKLVGSQTSNDLNCRFYTAMSYYHLKKYSQAIQLFNTCVNDECNVFSEEAEFYSALSYFNSGDKEEAIKCFNKIKTEKGFYAERASKFL